MWARGDLNPYAPCGAPAWQAGCVCRSATLLRPFWAGLRRAGGPVSLPPRSHNNRSATFENDRRPLRLLAFARGAREGLVAQYKHPQDFQLSIFRIDWRRISRIRSSISRRTSERPRIAAISTSPLELDMR